MTIRELIDRLSDKEVVMMALTLELLDVDEVRDNIVYSTLTEEEIIDALRVALSK